jgi:hypothetical protein
MRGHWLALREGDVPAFFAEYRDAETADARHDDVVGTPVGAGEGGVVRFFLHTHVR